MQGLQAYILSNEQIETLLSEGQIQVIDADGNSKTITYDDIKDDLKFIPAPVSSVITVGGIPVRTFEMDEKPDYDDIPGVWRG